MRKNTTTYYGLFQPTKENFVQEIQAKLEELKAKNNPPRKHRFSTQPAVVSSGPSNHSKTESGLLNEKINFLEGLLDAMRPNPKNAEPNPETLTEDRLEALLAQYPKATDSMAAATALKAIFGATNTWSVAGIARAASDIARENASKETNDITFMTNALNPL